MNHQSQDKVAQIRDFLNLECSLFSITRKCFKICLKQDFIKEKRLYLHKELFLLSKNDPIKQEFEAFFIECIGKCSEDFIQGRRFIKEKLNQETDRVQERNQGLYDSYYSTK